MNIAQFAVYRNKTVSVYFLQRSSNGNTKHAISSKYNDKQEEMKESKAVYVTKDKIRDDQNLVYQLYRSERDDRSQSAQRYEKRQDFGCQYDSKRDNEICTCRNVITYRRQEPRYFSGSPKQIYAYHRSRSFTEIGVGSVKALQKRKVKRVYLPETDDRGVGSSDLTSLISRKKYPQLICNGSYYDHKKTSSKCVGGILECNTGRLVSEKLSPITNTKSGTTSPNISCLCTNTDKGSNTVDTELETIGTQFNAKSDSGKISSGSKTPKNKTSTMDSRVNKKLSQHTQKSKLSNECIEKKAETEKAKVDDVLSSDSLVQHVHNLEIPCNDKRSRNSFHDPMENQLEREYRKMFSNTKFNDKPSFNKPIGECKSPSVLKRRFEALRRGVKKEDSYFKNNDSLTMDTSTKETPSRRDASVTSDPPSLISRSFSDTKADSVIAQKGGQDQIPKQTSRYKREKHTVQWPQDPTDSDQGVKGMFKMWEKKFNFEEENHEQHVSPKPSIEKDKKVVKDVKPKPEVSPKKEGKKFFFFKKRCKDKNKEAYKTKKNVTAGRCEIKDGLKLKVGEKTGNKIKEPKIEEEDDITRKAWLRRFLSKTVESARSVNVRWNNSMYATSSSTVFDLLETVYKNTGVVFKSRSEISTEPSSYYKSITQHRVNFVQDIEAWMVPKTIPDRPISHLPQMLKRNREIDRKNIGVTISDQKWFIEKSEAFSNKIEVVLRSGNYNAATEKKHSEYLRIDIPKHFFDSATSEESKRNLSSDEEVFKIVEYETNSEIGAVISNLKKRSTNSDIELIVNVRDSKTESNVLKTIIKRPTMQRDVIIQGSKVHIPQRCDVIGVGILTQRDLRDKKKTILRIEKNISDEESDIILQPNTNKFLLAENYFQDYYRHWTPLGLDLYSWCVSDRHLRSCSEKSVSSYFYQAEGTKSCPNIYDDFQATAVVKEPPLCEKSSTSSKCTCDEKPLSSDKCCKKFLKMFKKSDAKAKQEKRVLPKDSLEVFKRRKIYAASNKSKWAECQLAPISGTDCSGNNTKKTTMPGKKDCRKRVVVPDGILQYRGAGCDKSEIFRNSKHAIVNPIVSQEIPEPLCKEMCEEAKKPACENSNTPCKADEVLDSNIQLQSGEPTKEVCSCCIVQNKKPSCVNKKSDAPPPCSKCGSNSSQRSNSLQNISQKSSKQKVCDICGAPSQEGCPHQPKKPKKKENRSKKICDICGSTSQIGCPHCTKSPQASEKSSQSKQKLCEICGAPPQDACPHCPKSSQSKQKLCEICGIPPQEGCPHCQKLPQKPSVKPSQSKQKLGDIGGVSSQDGCPHCSKSPSKSSKPSKSKEKLCDICSVPPQDKSPHSSKSSSKSTKPSQSKQKLGDICGTSSQEGCPHCSKSPSKSSKPSKSKEKLCDICSVPPQDKSPPSSKSSSKSTKPSQSKQKLGDICGTSSQDGCPHCSKLPSKSSKRSKSKQKLCDKCSVSPQDGCPPSSKSSSKSTKPSKSKPKLGRASSQDGCPHSSKSPSKSSKPSKSKQKLGDICGTSSQGGCPHCSKSPSKSSKPSKSKQKLCDLCSATTLTSCPHCSKSASKSAKQIADSSNKSVKSSKRKQKRICGTPPKDGSPHSSKSSNKSVKSSKSKQKQCGTCGAPRKDGSPHSSKSSNESDSQNNCRVLIGPHHPSYNMSIDRNKNNNSDSSSEKGFSTSASEDQMSHYAPPPCLSNLSGCCYSPSTCRLINSESNIGSGCSSPSKSPKQKSHEPQTYQQTNTASGIGISLKIYPTQPKPPPPPPPPPPPKVSTCEVPPCNQIKKQTSKKTFTPPITGTNKSSEKFPWPTKNQKSNSSSPRTGSPKCSTPKPPSGKYGSPIPYTPKCSTTKSESSVHKCKKACTMKADQKAKECPGPCLPKTVNKNCPAEPCRLGGLMASSKESKPKTPTSTINANCTKQTCESKNCKKMKGSAKKPPSKKMNEKCPAEPCRANGPICSSKSSVTNATGIQLDVKPSEKKTCADDCSAWKAVKGQQVIPNATEKSKNFVVKDKDGKTIIERRDYGSEKHRPVLGDVYRDSNVRRVSTPTSERNVAKNTDKESSKSEQSLSNLIEIQFKLRVTQGDKATGVNVVNETDKSKKTTTENWEAAPSVYVVKNGTEEITEETNSNKNDINIKIIFRNFKPKNKTVDCKTINDEFSKNISKKFHTVSTGYSEIMTIQNEEQVYSIHRATVNLSSSVDESKVHSTISCGGFSKAITEIEASRTISQSTEQVNFQTNITEVENTEEKSISIRKNSQSEKLDESNTYESELPDFNDTDDPDIGLLDLHTSNELNCNTNDKDSSKEDKKLLLKKVFSKVGRTHKTKKSVRQLRDMLKIILTDSSEIDDVNTTSNELLKNVTYESLKPNYFRDTDSMNNYYQLDSNISSKDTKSKIMYPSIENTSDASKESDVSNKEQCRGCMCSKVAEKLNLSQKQTVRCCCRPNSKRDEETTCDLKNDEESFVFNYKSLEYADVETQNSKYTTSKINNLDVSIHSKSIANDSASIKILDGLEVEESPRTKQKDANYCSIKSRVKEFKIKKLNKNTVLGLTADDKVIVLNEKPEYERSKLGNKEDRKDVRNDQGKADILQSYEAKKAVLEIYAEKAESGEHLVAKLPKFVYDKESEMTNYEMMSVTMNVNR